MKTAEKDLVLLVADRSQEAVFSALLQHREKSLGIRSLTFDVFRHPALDTGVWSDAENYLRSFHSTYRHALVVFDHLGSGREDTVPDDLQKILTDRLARSGWDDRSAVVILVPELEIWIWSNSPHVERCLGWEAQSIDLWAWLRQAGWLSQNAVKPEHPKEALEAALKHIRRPLSSSIHECIARNVSLERCQDPCFLRFRSIVQGWYGQ